VLDGVIMKSLVWFKKRKKDTEEEDM